MSSVEAGVGRGISSITHDINMQKNNISLKFFNEKKILGRTFISM
jgi:hypothetical protein